MNMKRLGEAQHFKRELYEEAMQFSNAKDEGQQTGHIDTPTVPRDIWENPNKFTMRDVTKSHVSF